MFSKGKRMGLALSVLCLFGLSVVRVNAEDFGVYKGEGKEIILKTQGLEFHVGGGKWDWFWLEIKKADKPEKICSVSTYSESEASDDRYYNHFIQKSIEKMEVVVDEEDEKVVYIKATPVPNAPQKSSLVSLEMNLRIKKGIPCLFICQRLTNLANTPHMVTFYNKVRSLFHVCAGKDMKIHNLPTKEFHKKESWIRVKEKAKEEGLGTMTFVPVEPYPLFITTGNPSGLMFGYIHRRILEEECYLEYSAALSVSKTPEEIGALYEKVKDIKLGPFLLPDQQIVKLLK